MRKFRWLFVLMALFHYSACLFAQDDCIIVVYNNVLSENNLRADWGYAAWIEKGDKVVLFDTGTKANFLRDNLKKLNLDLAEISTIAISHDHYDHTGGLRSVLKQVEKGTKIFLPNDYDSSLKGDFPKMKFVVNKRFRQIEKGIWLTEVFVDADRGISEQALVLEKNNKLIVLTGCAHPGIAEMCAAVHRQFPAKELELVGGGFHLMRKTNDEVVAISDEIKRLGFKKVAPSHCTGDSSIAIFKKEWGNNFIQLNLGDAYFF